MTSETTPISGIPEDVEAFLLQSLHDRVSTLMPTLVRDLLANAYSVGFKAGQETLTVRLKDFLSEDTGYTVWPRDAQTRAVSEREPVPSPSSGLRDRAPRGAVRQAIFHALSTHPDGLNERELGVIMEQFNPNVSARSAGGELRRLKGRLYLQKGGLWFLRGDADQFRSLQKKTAEPQGPAGSLHPTAQEERDDPATIAA